jgi:hypothetical protein
MLIKLQSVYDLSAKKLKEKRLKIACHTIVSKKK